MFDRVKQFSSHAYFTLWVNYHTDRLITQSGRGVEEQAYSLRFEHNLSVGVRESQPANLKCALRETVASVVNS